MEAPGSAGNHRRRASVQTSVRQVAFVAVVAVVISACAASPQPAPEAQTSAEVMAAALVQLITVDHTFGEGPPPFTEYLVQARIDPFAGNPTGGERPARPLTPEEQAAIESAIGAYGPVRWIDDPADWRTDDLLPSIEGAVILGVGEPILNGDTALVPVSLWCGGLCGTWLTYRLDLVDGAWTVTGIEGPISIS